MNTSSQGLSVLSSFQTGELPSLAVWEADDSLQLKSSSALLFSARYLLTHICVLKRILELISSLFRTYPTLSLKERLAALLCRKDLQTTLCSMHNERSVIPRRFVQAPDVSTHTRKPSAKSYS